MTWKIKVGELWNSKKQNDSETNLIPMCLVEMETGIKKKKDGRKGKVQRRQWDAARPVQAPGHLRPWPGDFENEDVAVPVG